MTQKQKKTRRMKMKSLMNRTKTIKMKMMTAVNAVMISLSQGQIRLVNLAVMTTIQMGLQRRRKRKIRAIRRRSKS